MVKIPYFIGFFIISMIVNNYVPGMSTISPALVYVAKIGLTLTLFLIGAGLSGKLIKSVGTKPLLQGIILWIVISLAALWAIKTVV